MKELITKKMQNDSAAVDNNDKFLDGEMFATMLRGGAAQLRANAKEVNDLNVFPVPDGDTGDNMSMTIDGGVAALEGFHSSDLAEVTKTLSRGMLLGARGNSGVILSQFFAGMTKGFSKFKKANAVAVVKAMQEGVKQAYASVITPTEGTILTVAREAVEYAISKTDDATTITELFTNLIKEMYDSLQRTPDLLAALKEANVIDSGGAGLFYIMQGFLKILKGEEIKESAPIQLTSNAGIDLSAFTADSVMTYGYCTELLLQLMNSKVDPDEFDVRIISDHLQTLGDSIVCFKTDSIVKIHVHTKTPERVLEFCRQYGEFLTVKIENMNVQHSQTMTEQPNSRPMKDYGTVAVAMGDGICEMFTQLGVDVVVHGGQTQNPSANDFLEAFEKVNARHIFVLPNNGNIIMAAKQAGDLYEKGEVYVIESKDLGQGYAAISALNFTSDDPAQISKTLIEAMQSVSTGFISPAIRDADLNGVHIQKDDFIGFADKTMRVSCKTLLEASRELIKSMFNDEVYMITAFVGQDATTDDVSDLQSWIEEEYPDLEFYTVNGGQGVYPFIFVAE